MAPTAGLSTPWFSTRGFQRHLSPSSDTHSASDSHFLFFCQVSSGAVVPFYRCKD